MTRPRFFGGPGAFVYGGLEKARLTRDQRPRPGYALARSTPGAVGGFKTGLPLWQRGRVVTAWVKRVAARDAPNREPAAARRAMQTEALGGVARTRGLEAADSAEQLRQRQLIDANQKNQRACDNRPPECAAQPVNWLARTSGFLMVTRGGKHRPSLRRLMPTRRAIRRSVSRSASRSASCSNSNGFPCIGGRPAERELFEFERLSMHRRAPRGARAVRIRTAFHASEGAPRSASCSNSNGFPCIG